MANAALAVVPDSPAAIGVPAKAKNLESKLAAIALAVGRIEKRGVNKEQNYKFASESDIIDAVKRECYAHNVSLRFATVPGSLALTEFASKSGTRGTEATIEIRMILKDGDDPSQVIEETFPGIARDYGDKALWKAITGAKKYAHICTFNISTGDDPEHDGAGNADRGNRQQREASPKDLHDARESVRKLAKERGFEPSVIATVWHDLTNGQTAAGWEGAALGELRGLYKALKAHAAASGERSDAADTSSEAVASASAPESGTTTPIAEAGSETEIAATRESLIGWVAEKLRQINASDEDADVQQAAESVRNDTIAAYLADDSADADFVPPVAYAWRELTDAEIREFWARIRKIRKAARGTR